MSPGKLVGGGLAFVVLTVGIFWYQFQRIQAADATPHLDELHWSWLLLIVLCLPIETLTSGLRIWVIGRVLHTGLDLWTCIKAEWANAAISALTPSQSGGGPGQIYILSRAGARVSTALSISLLSFAGTMASLVLMGLYSLVVLRLDRAGPLFAAAVWTPIAIATAMALGASCPGAIRLAITSGSRAVRRLRGRGSERLTARLVEIVDTYRNDVVGFLRRGKATFAVVCLLSLTFLLARAFLPYLCLRFLGIDAWSARHVVEAQMALIFLVFFAPTPGGAGLAEGASLAIMAEVVPVGFAPYYNLLWRFSTMYLAASAGLVCVCRALVEDAGSLIRGRSLLR